MTDWSLISAAITSASGRPFRFANHQANGGGCINEAYTLNGEDGTRYFVKLNDAQHAAMFDAEAAGLEAIATTNTIRVPQPVTHGICGTRTFLVLEHLDLNGRGNARLLGEQLAALHRCISLPLPCREITSDLAALPPSRMASSPIRIGVRVDTLRSCASTPILPFPDGTTSQPTKPASGQVVGYLQGGRKEGASSQFGFAQDNFLGTTPQPNGWTDDWITFWRERRLGFQLRLAAENGSGGNLQRLGAKLLDELPALFDGYTPQPSLLHGDLWSGNHGYLAGGTPAIFDPAAYYGDRECDIAMTELFGGFSADFYAAYRASYPLDAGYAVRKELYNLYHILNHANLFGGSYARQAEQIMQRLLAAVG